MVLFAKQAGQFSNQKGRSKMCLLLRSVKIILLKCFLSSLEEEKVLKGLSLKPGRSEKIPKATSFACRFATTLCVCLILAMGFLLTACSGDDEKSTENNPNGTTDGETTRNKDTTPNSTPSGSDHWILSQPFQRIKVGSFTMGSPKIESYRDGDEDPVQVQITKPFEIMTTEVTQSMWVKVMGSNPSSFKLQGHCSNHDSENDMCPNHPVEQVSWDDVQEFLGKLNEALGLTGCDGTPSSATGCYRLPTEAEWEYSARAGTTKVFSFGDNSAKDYAWYRYSRNNSDRQTQAVGLKRANPWLLYDVHGNVWEWVQDSYVSTLPGGVDPLNTSGDSSSTRIFRGGSWRSNAGDLRTANRGKVNANHRADNVGFRLVRTL